MNKAQFIEAVAGKTGASKKDTAAVIEAYHEVVAEAMKQGDPVQLMGFASYVPKEKAARTGRNPKTGEEIKIPASKTVQFKVSKALKDSIR